jgi:hypothetical protein
MIPHSDGVPARRFPFVKAATFLVATRSRRIHPGWRTERSAALAQERRAS